MSILVTRSLSKWFGEVVALNGIDIEIGPGITGILGPNGAGKST
ncbi:MAG TPA: ABC transporter, partial [Planctomycetes bacterium]|nr:ABC transporter [Planctomycetota bacterium]